MYVWGDNRQALLYVILTMSLERFGETLFFFVFFGIENERMNNMIDMYLLEKYTQAWRIVHA